MREINYSTPKVKVRIDNVRYTYSGDTVHCFITMKRFDRDDAYCQLMDVANVLGFAYATHAQHRWHKPYPQYEIRSGTDSYIYDPSDYEYHGMASYKQGDNRDLQLAKNIAYKKAYRQLMAFYYNCYTNLYNRVMSYATDVWFEQMAQLSDRWMDVDMEIRDTVYPE